MNLSDNESVLSLTTHKEGFVVATTTAHELLIFKACVDKEGHITLGPPIRRGCEFGYKLM